MLTRYQDVLSRDSLKSDLEAKLTVIFHNYGIDLETSQMVYERHKDAPPIARNASPVAGNIVWARQLLRRIEAPMVRFKQSAQLMSTCASRSNEWPASGAHSARPEPCGLADADGAFSHRARARRKESKKIVKTYNRCVAIPRGPDGMPSQHRPAASPRLLGFGWRAAFAPPPPTTTPRSRLF